MKVLFAVNNESVSESIVKKYQKDYKEIISYKNVYYFNAIIKEMQRDKTYDRIVIGEDLEPFANNNYETIDRFLFEKLDSISDEATDNNEKETPIILICSDRRTKSDGLLVKLFGIGIYSAIIGRDRSIEEVCRLINRPRTKKEAKIYYKIDSDDVSYQAENETDVSETEIQSILKHYKSLGKNEEKYVESFNNIATQYTDAQLRIIIKFLPIGVKAVLEANSPKYQEIITFGDKQYKKRNTVDVGKSYEVKDKKKKEVKVGEETLRIDAIEKRVSNPLTGKPIIIPSASKANKAEELKDKLEEIKETPIVSKSVQPIIDLEEDNDELEDIFNPIEEEPKRGRGRPKKDTNVQPLNVVTDSKKGRGRPKKIQTQPEPVNLFEMEEETSQDQDNMLPGLEEDNVLPEVKEEGITLPGVEEHQPHSNNNYQSSYSQLENNKYRNEYTNQQNYNKTQDIQQANYSYTSSYNMDNLLTKDKKLVSFVGTTKNGTSFIINNLAMLFSSIGINTAILDVTENRNSYYIFTNNDEVLRQTAMNSIPKLQEGRAEGIKVNKNLTVYTSLPGEEVENNNIGEILSTLVNNYSLVLIDCDFKTNDQYFALSQEIYLVQTMDILTIQPLTSFLRDLKNKGILEQEKLRIVLNKTAKVRGLSERVLIGGIAYYNDPSMSFMTELFNKELVKFCNIPFDVATYVAYLEAVVNCNISLNSYGKAFMIKLKELANMVYPLLNKQSYRPKQTSYNNSTPFSNNMNSTLNQMRNKY